MCSIKLKIGMLYHMNNISKHRFLEICQCAFKVPNIVFWKYAANVQENTHVNWDFNKVAKPLYWNRISSWVNLLHISRTIFPKNTSDWLLLIVIEIIALLKNCWIWASSSFKLIGHFYDIIQNAGAYLKSIL